jgi:hypothetical protein
VAPQWREALAYNRGFPLDEDDFAASAVLPPGPAPAALGGRVVPRAAAPDWRNEHEHEDDAEGAAEEHDAPGAPPRCALRDLLPLPLRLPGGAEAPSVLLLTRLQVRGVMRQMGLGVPAGGTMRPGQLPGDSDSEEEAEEGA